MIKPYSAQCFAAQIPSGDSPKASVSPARKARNPKTGEEIQIGARRSPMFKPGKALKEAVEG